MNQASRKWSAYICKGQDIKYLLLGMELKLRPLTNLLVNYDIKRDTFLENKGGENVYTINKTPCLQSGSISGDREFELRCLDPSVGIQWHV